MKINGVAIIGLLLAVAAFAGVFVLGMVLNPSPAVVIVAARDLDKGTKLSQLGEGDLAQAEMRGSSGVIARMLTMDEYTKYAGTDAVLTDNIRKGDPIMEDSILSPENPAAAQYTSLLLADPKLVAITIDAKNLIPGGVRSGDWIDINVAVDNVRDNSQANQSPLNNQMASQSMGTGTVLINGTPVPVAKPGTTTQPVQAEQPGQPAAGPTPTRLPYIVPIAKTIVRNAYIASVNREQRNSTGVDGNTKVIYGDVTGLTVLIPREAQEYVVMANSAGKLRFSLLSPQAAEEEGPTVGAALSDLIDKFYADRATLTPAPTAGPTIVLPTATQAAPQATPTATKAP